MFRNPRENRKLAPTSHLSPSVGRPPSPPRFDGGRSTMPSRPTPKQAAPKTSTTPAQPSKMQTTLVGTEWGKKSPANNGPKSKPKATSNGNIMTFFKKAEELNNRLFMEERGTKSISEGELADVDVGWRDDSIGGFIADGADATDERYNENGGSNKKRKVIEELPASACSPPPPDGETVSFKISTEGVGRRSSKDVRKAGPFLDDSESDTEDTKSTVVRRGMKTGYEPSNTLTDSNTFESPITPNIRRRDVFPNAVRPPQLRSETTSFPEENGFDEFDGLEDDEILEGEEYDERRWMEEQQRLEMAEAAFEGDFDDEDVPSMFPDDEVGKVRGQCGDGLSISACPVCSASLEGQSEHDVSVHVNACLDSPSSLDEAKAPNPSVTPSTKTTNSKMFKRPPRPARPGQENPFTLGEPVGSSKSAFSRLMTGHAEDAAWATAAASESAARGKPSYQRTCPFYKILPGFYICVDGFRYGAVQGQNAYFLSHFHSDHYVGLTASWAHGPIYCSKVTANLVRQQLGVNPKWVVDLEFEKKTEVPGTEGVQVTMIPANHCPGSSLFLFEKEVGKGRVSKLQRVLHCGDFRACKAHVEHPLLRPEVLDVVSGKTRQQKLDVCYLDTTYLNPKYAFPPQEQVIQACADMCVSLSKIRADETDEWEQTKRQRAGQGMVKFLQKDPSDEKNDGDPGDEDEDVDAMKITKSGSTKKRGRLLVIVGTYSIGKERICMGIARALKSKIYAPKNKQRICRALEDPELNELLTNDPREAQVHMTPLFEIRADTLEDYLRDYRDHFTRAVGFRPSGWNYRPPKSRFTESPSVQTVLHSDNWKSHFTMKDLVTQRGSTNRASCFGVPYSEHSSFRELTMFVCALRIDKIIPTVNVGSAKSREKMKAWCEKWAAEKKKNGLFRLSEDGSGW